MLAQAGRGRGLSLRRAGLTISALGVVFGDIGTSPLYTFKTVLELGGNQPHAPLGVLSLIIWTLIVVTTIKYVSFAMRMDNKGEGGILALMALLGARHKHRPAIIAFGLFGAALIYGDGAITPAISVLSALEGLNMVTSAFTPYVLPTAVAILVFLFAIQPLGTARIGQTFGPVMLLWFLVIGLLGIWGIMRNPAVLAALSPTYAAFFLMNGGLAAFFVLGGVFLCVTGAEALYADMGHFGVGPIRVAWYAVVFPCLVLNYAGQAAIAMQGDVGPNNTFYLLCPEPLLVPLIFLATVATIIASQSIITGAFSMTRQAIQLGWFPRLNIIQTSHTGYGQIYVGPVNWMLMVVTVSLALWFGKSDNLAAAYGIAVSATMLLTSILLLFALREVWGWGALASILVVGVFLIVDASFVIANSAKILEGGYVPLLLAGAVYITMYIWHRGMAAVGRRLQENLTPLNTFLTRIETAKIPRVPGTAVFLTRATSETPPVMLWHLRHSRALHEHLIALTAVTESVPFVDDEQRTTFTQLAPNFWRAIVRYGFMERPDVPHVLEQLSARGCGFDLSDVTYFVGHETVIAREDGRGLPRWQEAVFASMERNAAHITDFFRLPSDQVVEIGRHIAI
ncbi:MAG: potassium transporter Kup [Proteobacteria bacterium]|nr:MAG: potassium transporter Kup [Pseudomonadota bacterium]